MKIKKQPFGQLPDGRTVSLYTLVADSGLRAGILDYGGIVVSLHTPDRDGELGDVVLGFDTLDDYLTRSPFFGALIGRYGNRIANGKFTLDGVEVTLACNGGQHHLHGGKVGFDKKIWASHAFESPDGPALKLSYTSPDGEEGYPGKLDVTVVYTLTDDALKLEYTATTDKPTVVNLTNHSYFNLSCGKESTIHDHVAMINAGTVTAADAALIPTGDLLDVTGTPFDFRTPTRIGERIEDDFELLRNGGGYDHNYICDGDMGTLRHIATISEPLTGRIMKVSTTEPAVQLYCSNMMPPTLPGKGGAVYGKRSALCLETQHYPDSPNHPNFPTTTLRPGETYHSVTVYSFSAE